MNDKQVEEFAQNFLSNFVQGEYQDSVKAHLENQIQEGNITDDDSDLILTELDTYVVCYIDRNKYKVVSND